MASASSTLKGATCSRNTLTLKEKYSVIKEAEKHAKPDIKAIATQFHCGKTQVYTILQKRASITEMYESNASDGLQHCSKRSRTSKYADVNDKLYEWYLMAVRKNIYPDGPILCEQAKKIAERLGIADFKASNGWFEKWKVKHNIKKMKISGESGSVSGQTIDSWKERLPEILAGYNPREIWNMDETGCFWKTLPTTGLAQKSKSCKGGKNSKQRVTLAFFVNAAGGKESKPILIGSSENPRCFKGVDKKQLPVHYHHNASSWMDGDILHKVLRMINQRLLSEGRSVLLLMDNAGCHPVDVVDKYSNIKVVFLPPNTTSMLQPLDLGIIKSFKVHYRKSFLSHVIAKLEESSSASEIVKSVNILHALRWTAQAWECVSSETIKKCFRNAGILTADFSVVSSRSTTSTDPFSDLEADPNLGDLEHLINDISGETCSVEEFVSGDNELPTCQDMASEHWEEEFLAQLTDDTNSDVVEPSEEPNDDDISDSVTAVPKIRNFREVIISLEDIAAFLDYRGHTKEANETSRLLDVVTTLSISSSKSQTSLDTFFGRI